MKVTVLLLLSILIGITFSFCMDNSDCVGGPSHCHPDNVCRESPFRLCETNNECDSFYSICSDGICVKCIGDDDCPRDGSNIYRCGDRGFQCVFTNGECLEDADCPFANPCLIEVGETVGTCKCVESKDCPYNLPVCDNNKCSSCKKHSDCPLENPFRSACIDERCITYAFDQCVSHSDCPPASKPDNKVCNYYSGHGILGYCEYGCAKDSDCPMASDDNPRKTHCINNKCVDGCLPNPDDVLRSIHCTNASLPRCNTLYNVDNKGIGRCDVECRTNFDCRFVEGDSLKALCVKGKCINPACKVKEDCHVNIDKPACNTATQECRACSILADCIGNPSGPKCVSGSCKCKTVADCSGKGQGNVCNQLAEVCSCMTDLDCKAVNTRFCTNSLIYSGVKTCGNCSTDTDCSSDGSAICSFKFPTSRCVSVNCKKSPSGSAVIGGSCGCIDDSHCISLPNTPACDCAAGKCVSCIKDIHCANHQRCSDAKKCVSLKCTQDADCYTKEINIRGKSSQDTRCSDAGVCVPASDATICVNSISNPISPSS